MTRHRPPECRCFATTAPRQNVVVSRARLALPVLLCVALILMVPSSFVSPAAALNIILDYQPENNSENPAFDPTGDNLIDIMQAAAAHWESIILDDHDITIRFWYDNLDDTTLANALNVDGSANRVDIGRVKFDTRDTENQLRNWYFDPTPTDDSEFAMQHKSYATDGDSAWFSGTPLNLSLIHI